MARRLKITTLGAPSPAAAPGAAPQHLLEQMRECWHTRLQWVLPDRPDLIVLPEFSDCHLNQSYPEKMEYARAVGDAMLDYYCETARAHACHIAYPTLRVRDGRAANHVYLIGPQGQVLGGYSKNHLTINEIEGGLCCGTKAVVLETEFGRVGFAVCFDLNFEKLRLQYAAAQPDLILFPSLYHGGLMQAYWAYSCRAHFVSCLGHGGLRSNIIAPTGEMLASTTVYRPYATATVNLDCVLVHIDYNADKLRALKARYGPGVAISDPDHLGAVLLSCEMEETTARALAAEFEIELLDQYLARAAARQEENRARNDF